MRPASSQRGYALLAALVVTALAAVFAAAAVAAVSARQSIVSADVANARAQAAAKEALTRVCLELRRHPAALEGELSGAATTAGGEAWQASWVAADTAAGVPWPVAVVQLEGSYGDARKRLSAVVELRAEPVPQGMVAAGDVDLQAPLRVIGSGLYTGGCVRGREWLEFGSLDPGAARRRQPTSCAETYGRRPGCTAWAACGRPARRSTLRLKQAQSIPTTPTWIRVTTTCRGS